MGGTLNPDQQQGQQEQEGELDDDEELLVVGNVEKNEKCPYTRKDVSAWDTCTGVLDVVGWWGWWGGGDSTER